MRRTIGSVVALVAASTTQAGPALAGPAVAEHARAARPAWHVTLQVKNPTVTVGQKVRLTGTVNRSAAGGLVSLYERYDAGRPWRYQRNALVRRDGSFSTWDTPSQNHRRQYRAVMPATKRHHRGVSPAVTVDVYRWVSLTTMASVNDVFFDVEPSVAMNGQTYPSSLEATVPHFTGAPTTESVEFNVDHECTAFRGTFGLSDDSASGSQATVTASADGTPWLSQSFGLGQSAPGPVTWDTPPLKLLFTSTSTVDGADGLGAVGTPEVYCEQR